MAPDGLDDDDWEPPGPLLPPDDRLWRHPSELKRLASVRRATGEPRMLVVAALAGAIGALLGGGLVGVLVRTGGDDRPPRPVEQVATPVSVMARPGEQLDVAAMVAAVAPALAQIEAERRTGRSKGSGVIWRSDGLLLTNQHLVAGAQRITVTLADGRRQEGRLIGADVATDLAVVKIAGEGLPVATVGSATALRVGQPAVAVFAATGGSSGPMVTSGIISALGREVPRSSMPPLLDMIQTDTQAPPGGTGGALLDETGAVIGITTDLGDTADGPASIAYATPIDIARVVATQLLESGEVAHVWLGIDGQDLDPATAERLGVQGGVLVKGVWAGSPAAECQLRPGDVVTGIGDEPVTSMTSLVVLLRLRAPGDVVTVRYSRDATSRITRTELVERPRGPRRRV